MLACTCITKYNHTLTLVSPLKHIHNIHTHSIYTHLIHTHNPHTHTSFKNQVAWCMCSTVAGYSTPPWAVNGTTLSQHHPSTTATITTATTTITHHRSLGCSTPPHHASPHHTHHTYPPPSPQPHACGQRCVDHRQYSAAHGCCTVEIVFGTGCCCAMCDATGALAAVCSDVPLGDGGWGWGWG